MSMDDFSRNIIIEMEFSYSRPNNTHPLPPYRNDSVVTGSTV